MLTTTQRTGGENGLPVPDGPDPAQHFRAGEGGQEAAQYLQSLVNEQAEQDWEFYRVDTIGVEVRPGCLFSLLGRSAEYTQYFVVTFRREADSST